MCFIDIYFFPNSHNSEGHDIFITENLVTVCFLHKMKNKSLKQFTKFSNVNDLFFIYNIIYIYIYIYIPAHWHMVRVFANGPEEWGSIPD